MLQHASLSRLLTVATALLLLPGALKEVNPPPTSSSLVLPSSVPPLLPLFSTLLLSLAACWSSSVSEPVTSLQLASPRRAATAMADSPLNHSWPSFSKLWMKRWSFKRGTACWFPPRWAPVNASEDEGWRKGLRVSWMSQLLLFWMGKCRQTLVDGGGKWSWKRFCSSVATGKFNSVCTMYFLLSYIPMDVFWDFFSTSFLKHFP